MAAKQSPVRAVASALEIAQRWPIFPCNPLNKKPLTTSGFLDATQDRARITTWWKKHPNAMIGVPTGAVSGFWVVDVDVESGDRSGMQTWREWTEAGGLGATRVHRTPRGGLHYLFRYDPTRPVKSSAGKLHQYIDVRGDGGYVVVPPSQSAEGNSYSVARDLEITDPPEWLYGKVAGLGGNREEKEKERRSERPEVAKIRAALSVIPSDNYDVWYKVGAAVRRELNSELGWGLFREWSARSPKFSEHECREKWDQVSDVTQITAGTIFHVATEYDPTWIDRWEEEQRRNRQPVIRVAELFPISEDSIPTRPWLVPGLLLRRSLTLTAAPGGTGKSILTLCVAIMCALGAPWSDWRPRGQYKVLVINAEEDTEEQRRRAFAVAARSMHVERNADLQGKIMAADNPSDIIVAKFNARTRSMTREPLADQLIRIVKQLKIDVVIVDPFAETFEGEETNTELKWVGALWRDIARQTDTAVWLIHHTKKYASEMAGDIEASRGGTALGNIARIGTTMFPMTKDEATLLGILESDRRQYVRFDDAKANYHMQSARAQWFKSETCQLQNQHGDVPGDNVGVLTPWDAPVAGGVDVSMLAQLLSRIDAGIHDKQGNFLGEYYTAQKNQRAGDNFNRWVGLLLMEDLKCSEMQAVNLIKELTAKNTLVQFSYKNPRNRTMSRGCGSMTKKRAMEAPPEAQSKMEV